MTRVSKTTIMVAAGGPNRRAAAKTNVSETESLAGMPGMRTVKEPLRRVRTASTSQLESTGACRNRIERLQHDAHTCRDDDRYVQPAGAAEIG